MNSALGVAARGIAKARTIPLPKRAVAPSAPMTGPPRTLRQGVGMVNRRLRAGKGLRVPKKKKKKGGCKCA